MPAKTQPRASLYVRLSVAANGENMSLAGMTEDLRALCEREGFDEVALHVDNGLSGAVRDRPQFLAWLADAREGRADVLVTWHTDRLSREGLQVAAMLLDVVEGKDRDSGKVVHAPVRLFDSKGLDSREGESFRLRFVLQAEIARAERERMRDRNRAAYRRVRAAGRWSGATPYGYRPADNPNGPGKVLEIDPGRARSVAATPNLATGPSRGMTGSPRPETGCPIWSTG